MPGHRREGHKGGKKKNTHCAKGHPLEGWNLLSNGYTRNCRICTYDRRKKRYAEHKAAAESIDLVNGLRKTKYPMIKDIAFSLAQGKEVLVKGLGVYHKIKRIEPTYDTFQKWRLIDVDGNPHKILFQSIRIREMSDLKTTGEL